jgi:uncharacterized protein with PQ loop repeat
MNAFALGLAYVGSALGVAMVVPQIVRTLRHPTLVGVAPMSWALTALSCTTWLIYGVRADEPPQIPGNVLLVSGAVAIVLLVPSAWSRGARALALVGIGGVLVATAFSIDPSAVGYLAFGVGVLSMWPQFWRSVVDRHGPADVGLSIPSFVVKVVSQLCWFTFAVLVGDVAVLIAACLTIATTLVILVVEVRRRRPAGSAGQATAIQAQDDGGSRREPSLLR